MFRNALRSCVRLVPQARVLVSQISRSPTVVLRRTYVVDRLGEKVDAKIDNVSQNEYNTLVKEYLESLGDQLDELGGEYPEIEIDLSQGVLTLSLSSGTYVINRQPANKQIWLSSPISGPNRYDLVGGQWIALRDNSILTELLNQELSEALGAEIKLDLSR